MRYAWPVLVCLMLVALGLWGCSGQNEVIGKGPVSLLFDNEGGSTIHVSVHWTGPEGRVLSRSFDVEGYGSVDLRIAQSERYRIELTGSAAGATTDQ
jgi:hypothetical protein